MRDAAPDFVCWWQPAGLKRTHNYWLSLPPAPSQGEVLVATRRVSPTHIEVETRGTDAAIVHLPEPYVDFLQHSVQIDFNTQSEWHRVKPNFKLAEQSAQESGDVCLIYPTAVSLPKKVSRPFSPTFGGPYNPVFQ